MRELLIQNDGTLENVSFRGPFYIHAKSPREQLLHNNHKHGSSTKDFNKYKYKYKNTGPTQSTIPFPHPKPNSVRYEDPYDHIHHMGHNHENSHPIDTKEQHMKNNEVEQDELYDKTNYYLIA